MNITIKSIQTSTECCYSHKFKLQIFEHKIHTENNSRARATLLSTQKTSHQKYITSSDLRSCGNTAKFQQITKLSTVTVWNKQCCYLQMWYRILPANLNSINRFEHNGVYCCHLLPLSVTTNHDCVYNYGMSVTNVASKQAL